jgi:catechol 2,3-dioxygenase-like lactoylglutathione lyase family enzyme
MNGISHVAIGVRDLERSLRFYRDLLGLEVRSDQMQPIGGMPTLSANPETGKRRAVNLRYGKGNDRGFLVCRRGQEERVARRSSLIKSVFRISHGRSTSPTRASASTAIIAEPEQTADPVDALVMPCEFRRRARNHGVHITALRLLGGSKTQRFSRLARKWSPNHEAES